MGPVLLRAGQRGGLESTIGLPGGTCFFSRPPILMEVVFPHVTVQVLTWWAQEPLDMSWTMLAQCTKPRLPGCSGHWTLQAFPHVAGEGA